MEGVVDHYMRELLTGIGGFDLCISEFLRVTTMLYPAKVFYKCCPELLTNDDLARDANAFSNKLLPNGASPKISHTRSNVPVHIQLLGQCPEMMALNAAKAVSLGAAGIDLNFGCPSKTVNRHKGGAALLAAPNQMAGIISAVREAVPSHVTVTAKMRLGLEDTNEAVAIAKIVEQAGANTLTVHARTKAQGYKPPVHWQVIAEIRQALSINVVANGDVVDYQSYLACQRITECEDIMIGRGVLMNPFMAQHIRQKSYMLPAWRDVVECLLYKKQVMMDTKDLKYYPSRTKQWLNYLRNTFPEAERDLKAVRLMRETESVYQYLQSSEALS